MKHMFLEVEKTEGDERKQKEQALILDPLVSTPWLKEWYIYVYYYSWHLVGPQLKILQR